MAHNNLIVLMAVLFPSEEDVIYTNIEVGHLLFSALMHFDIEIDNFVPSHKFKTSGVF